MLRLIIVLVLLSVGIASAGKDVKTGDVYTSSTGFSGKRMHLSVTPGPYFVQKKKMKFGSIKIRPQMAIWLEDTAGNFIKTVYVTRSFGKQKWYLLKEHRDSTYRTSCMPYWFNRMKKGGEKAPTPAKPFPDGITGATPTKNFSVDFNVPENLSEVVLLIEWNSSFDNNESFSVKDVAFNGQPSCIARARIPLNSIGSDPLPLEIIGHGGNNGGDATLYTDMEKMTTAPTILGKMIVTAVQ